MKAFSFFCISLFVLLPLQARAERIKIAVVVPLSGPVAEYGTAMQNGIRLAQQENIDGLNELEFTYEDHRYDNAAAVSIVNKLASAGDISLVYLWGYGMCQAAAPVAEARRLPVLAVSAEEGLNIGKKHVVRFSYRAEQLSEAILAHLRAHRMKRIGMVKTDIAYLTAIADGIEKGLQAGESVDLVDSYQIMEADFRSSITKLKLRHYDALGALLAPGQVSEFFKQSHAVGFKAPLIFGASPFESVTEIRKAGGLMEGAIFPGLDVSEHFRGRYMAQFKNDAQLGWAANAYDFAVLAAAVARELRGRSERPALLDELRKIRSLEGAEGPFYYTEDNGLGARFEFRVVMKRIGADSYTVIRDPAAGR